MTLFHHVIHFFARKYFVIYLIVSGVIFAWKGQRLPYNPWIFWFEIGILIASSVLHYFGFILSYIDRRLLAGALIVPNILVSIYFLIWQTYVLRLEIVTNSILMGFQGLFIVSCFVDAGEQC